MITPTGPCEMGFFTSMAGYILAVIAGTVVLSVTMTVYVALNLELGSALPAGLIVASSIVLVPIIAICAMPGFVLLLWLSSPAQLAKWQVCCFAGVVNAVVCGILISLIFGRFVQLDVLANEAGANIGILSGLFFMSIPAGLTAGWVYWVWRRHIVSKFSRISDR